MPDPPDLPKRQRRRAAPRGSLQGSPQGSYAELHCRTNFSFLEGASHPDELVVRAAELGYGALAITDKNSLAGIVRAHAAAKESGLKLLIGAEITPLDAPPVVLWATDRAAYGRLCRLITKGRRRAAKGACELTLDDIAAHDTGLLAGVVVPPDVPGRAARAPSANRAAENDQAASPTVRPTGGRDVQTPNPAALGQYRDIFGDRCYLLVELHYGVDDQGRLERLLQAARRAGIVSVAAGDVHYHAPARMLLQHVLTAIRHGTTVAELGPRLLPNARRHLRPLDEIRTVFARAPELVRRTVEVADRCSFSLDQLRYEYPEELAPPGETPLEYLTRLAWDGARERYGRVPDKVRRALQHELALVGELHYEAFFLTVYDIVQFARARDILCQGRGSAANSTVCYCLGVTAVDPMETDLLFERFISRERDEAPDIDVDFEHERREEVLQYVYQKYGRDRAGLAATVITYRPRSAIRDVGKALGLSLDRVDALAKNVDFRSEHAVLAKRCVQSGLDPASQVGRQLIQLVNELLGFPRHLSQHVGGMVITQGPLCELSPIENAAMADRTVIQWDKDDLEELGILKVDCLALGMLTAVHRCFDLIENHTGRRVTIADIPRDDSDVYDMICRADTVGVFQIESRAQMSMLPRLRPRRFYDLVIEVAIVRPGPIQGDMVHPYLRRRDGEEPITYPNPEIQKVLHRTLGVPLFQEQAMQLAMVAAGFTPGEADQLRRAMAGWRRPGLIDSFRQKLIEGMLARGHSLEFAENLFNQIRGFGEYGFPESHAASFAILAYVSAWLKFYYPAAFTAALMNSQPMGFYAPAQLVRDAQNHDVPVLPIDVNHSRFECVLVDPASAGGSHAISLIEEDSAQPSGQRSQAGRGHSLRLGFGLISGLRRADAESIVAAREAGGEFPSMADLARRTGLARPTLERLAEADAFQSLGHDRRAALWQALDHAGRCRPLPLFDSAAADDPATPVLPRLTEQEEVFADYHAAGMSLRRHPLSFFRDELTSMGVLAADRLLTYPAYRAVKVAGLVLMRQRPSTAKGITFVTLEDETGTANLVIRQAVWQHYDLIARRASSLIAHGLLERKNEVVHVVVRRLEDMAERLGRLDNKSRDFR